MLPILTPLNGGERGTVNVPPPPNFRPPKNIWDVGWSTTIVAKPEARTAAQKLGLRYEKKILSWLAEEEVLGKFPITRGPCLKFRDGHQHRICFPDAVVKIGERRHLIVEIKFQHMPEAWWQLRQLYEPVLKAGFPSHEFVLLEICRTFDPHTPFPEPPHLLESPSQFCSLLPGPIYVLPWRL